MNVLLVEDETLVRRFVKSMIDWEQHGFSVVAEASNGEEAWKMLQSMQVDIVLTDIRMPILDGFALIERICGKELLCEVVILSSYDDFEYVRTALKLNVSDYVHKATISEDELLNCLNKAKSDLLKRYVQLIVNGSAAQSPLSRKQVVGAKLLTLALEDRAESRLVPLLSEHEKIWTEPFEVALMSFPDPSGIDDRADDHNLLFPYKDYWIFAGHRLKDSAVSERAAFVVYGERPVTLEEWPAAHRLLEGRLEERKCEYDHSHTFHESIRKAVAYMKNHYMDDISLEVMSELVHVSPAYFSRLFLKETGRTFTDYLTNLRLSEAKHLLLHTDLPVYTVAERVGYRNARYFLKLFKETFGLTPTAFRMDGGASQGNGP